MSWFKRKCPAVKEEVIVSGPRKGKRTTYTCTLEPGHKGGHLWKAK